MKVNVSDLELLFRKISLIDMFNHPWVKLFEFNYLNELKVFTKDRTRSMSKLNKIISDSEKSTNAIKLNSCNQLTSVSPFNLSPEKIKDYTHEDKSHNTEEMLFSQVLNKISEKNKGKRTQIKLNLKAQEPLCVEKPSRNEQIDLFTFETFNNSINNKEETQKPILQDDVIDKLMKIEFKSNSIKALERLGDNKKKLKQNLTKDKSIWDSFSSLFK